ncbi:SAM-dependent MidA family methyltransferase [Paenibacillus cellulosilyticus]|uniref:SAM-dependent MidA family methyltransferase n=1 Tax=Paenibacillus cellulosilyticus TaxID=375489 RepID=A0A2V2Z1E5_9BACL|nr:SAM-dependent methyltransferase [Paenibacillus cellulosilyticus]PWW08642.1 SAM-dependent MidA family methyltransferase [Paenibacillus cellulosilyticus]QKS48883.1 tetratricopeptide repeat protein [Paenibacillus cellulosilyticus]
MTVNNGSQRYRFTEAPFWELQRQYYEQLGLKAWNNDQVPQYITCNPMIANAYAEMIMGIMQDRASQGHIEETVYIVELGAGAGRLAYHVIHELCELLDYAGKELPPFRYVMTDLAMSNVTAWQQHPKLQHYAAEGLLDFARFDAVNDTELNLFVSGLTIRPGDLQQPVVVVANYVFDSIPQELLYIGDGRVYEADVYVEYTEKAARDTVNGKLKPADELNQISLRYEHRREPAYEREDYLYRDLISLYQEELEDSHFLFPVAGLTCLERMNGLSQSGFVLLTADKGDHLLDNWKFAEPPILTLHGSFSLMANYHAFVHVFEQRGALALFPEQHYRNINVGCIIHVDNAKRYYQTKLAYRRFIERYGPDEFFSLKELVDQHLDTMSLHHFMSFWRLGGYDAEFFIQSSKRISSLLPDANDEEIEDLHRGIERMWSAYYVMAQRYNLAMDAGLILFEMDKYEDAKRYLQIAVEEENGDVVSTVFYCLAVCSFELEQEDDGVHYLKELLKLEPDHEEAAALLEGLEQG